MKSIDTQKIGEGLYDLMNNDHKTLVAFGMIPHEIMKYVMDKVEDRIVKTYEEEWGFSEDLIRGSIKKSFLNRIEREIAVSIYSRASELGKMVV